MVEPKKGDKYLVERLEQGGWLKCAYTNTKKAAEKAKARIMADGSEPTVRISSVTKPR